MTEKVQCVCQFDCCISDVVTGTCHTVAGGTAFPQTIVKQYDHLQYGSTLNNFQYQLNDDSKVCL